MNELFSVLFAVLAIICGLYTIYDSIAHITPAPSPWLIVTVTLLILMKLYSK